MVVTYQKGVINEFSQPALWVFGSLYVLYQFFLGSNPAAINDHVANVLGPDLIPLWLSGNAGPIILLGGMLIGWWRTTDVQDEDSLSDRTDLFETYVGVATIVSGFVVSSLLFGFVLYGKEYGIPSLPLLSVQIALTCGFVATSVAIGCAIGTLTSRGILGRLGAGVSILMILFLQVPATCIYIFFRGKSFSAFNPPAEPVLFFVRRLTPYRAYNVVTNGVYGVGNSDADALITTQQLHPAPNIDNTVTNAFIVEHTFDGSVPWYLSEWIGLAILAAWFGVSLAIMCWQTTSSEK